MTNGDGEPARLGILRADQRSSMGCRRLECHTGTVLPLVHVARSFMLLDRRDEGGERLAGLGRGRSLSVLGFRSGGGGDEPAVGLAAAANALDRLVRAIDSEQQCDK